MDFKSDSSWKATFFKENFNVDECLSTHTQKNDLETLRKELKAYGSALQQQMSEILKTETEAIVNLAEYLTNLNSKIEDLSVPICQLREEIRTLYDLIKNAQTSYNTMLEEIKINTTKSNHTHLKLEILLSSLYIDKMMTSKMDTSEDLILLERAVNRYSFQKNYLTELGILSSDTEENIKDVEDKLVEMINKKFLAAVKTNQSDTITRCLRMYDNLGKQKDVEKTLQVNVIRPALQMLFTEKNLERCNYDVNEIYNELFHIMRSEVDVLLDILQRHPELQSYNFVLNSFWQEVDKQSREGLPYITAPGNPELFQKRFISTWNFLEKIADKCGDKNLIRTNKTFQDHLKRFNLAVYFEIRFQQIAGDFEKDIVKKDSVKTKALPNELSFKLNITKALWESLKRCFHPDVFIDQLADQFLKLSMMLLSRYIKWFEITLKDLSTDKDKCEDFILNSLIDLTVLKNVIGLDTNDVETVNKTIYCVVPDRIKSVVFKLFATNNKSIITLSNKLQNHLIDLKIKESIQHLQNVGAIPRLYRRTNRSVPREASQYMIDAVKPITELNEKLKLFLQKELNITLDDIINSIINHVTNEYLNLVREVLRSVCKTEESLRRLKSRNFNSNEDSPQDTISDEMKIREQIKFDVSYFLQKLYTLSSSKTQSTMDQLKNEANQ